MTAPSTTAHELRLAGSATPVRLDVRADWRQTVTVIASIISVVLVGSGVVFTLNENRQQRMASSAQQAATEKANRAQLDILEQGQVTDRFGRAIDQLGANTAEIRMGGIYALGRLASDSTRDQRSIMEVLAAFALAHSQDRSPTVVDAGSARPIAIDVRAALAVIGARDRRHDNKFYFDLRRANFAGRSLPNQRLMGVDFRRADLSSADLSMSDFSCTEDPCANLSMTYMRHVDLHGSNLTGANLSGSDLTSNANLSGAILDRSNLSGTNLTGADLRGASLVGIRGATKAYIMANAITDTTTKFSN